MKRLVVIAPIARVIVGCALAAAFVFKLSLVQVDGGHVVAGVDAFAYMLRLHNVLPAPMTLGVAWFVMSLEALLAALLLSHVWPRLAAVSAAAMLGAFSVYLLYARLYNGEAKCACFGSLPSGTVGMSIARNLALVLLCAVGAAGVPSRAQRRSAPSGEEPRLADPGI